MNTLRIVAVWLVLCVIWSSTWVVIKIGLDDLPPLLFAGLRFVIASTVLLAINAVRGVRAPRTGRSWAFVAVTGWLTFSINYGALFWGEEQVASGLAAVLQAAIPAFGLVLAHYYLPAERLTWTKAGGVLLGVVGLGVIFANELHLAGARALWGGAATVAGGLSVAYANILVKAYGRDFDPGMLAGWQMFFGWVPLVGVGWIVEGNPWKYHWSGQAVFCLFYLALLGSSLAFCLLYWLTRRADITKIMLISLVTPVAAVAIGAAVRHEHLSSRTLVGAAAVLAGLGLVIFKRQAPNTA